MQQCWSEVLLLLLLLVLLLLPLHRHLPLPLPLPLHLHLLQSPPAPPDLMPKNAATTTAHCRHPQKQQL